VAGAIILAHFLFTDIFFHSRPLVLKVPGVGHGIVGMTPEIESGITVAEKRAQGTVDAAAEKANKYRTGVGICKWVGIVITAVMMVVAGLRGVVVTSGMEKNPDELLNALKAEIGERKKLGILIALLSAAVAATTMIGSHLESEQGAARDRAKDLHNRLYVARDKMLNAKTPSEFLEVKKLYDEIPLQ
jgi:hypothetical protein